MLVLLGLRHMFNDLGVKEVGLCGLLEVDALRLY